MNLLTFRRCLVSSPLFLLLGAGCGGASSSAADYGTDAGGGGTGGGAATGGTGGGIAGAAGGVTSTPLTTASTGGVAAGGTIAGDAAATAPFYDPVSTEHITNAFVLVRQFAAGLLVSPEVHFISVQGDPTGAPGATYDATPLRWTYQFSACDASVQPCTNALFFTLTQPGLTVAGPFTGASSGLSLLETEFRAAVPLDFTQILARSAPNQEFCPIGSTSLKSQYIRLQGGVKSGSGKPLWWWTFECANVVNGQPVYRQTNGDPIT